MSKICLYEEYCSISFIHFFYLLIFLVFTFSCWRKKKPSGLPRHPTASAKFTGNGLFTAYWAYVQSRTYSLYHAAKKNNKMDAERRPWDFLCDTLNLVWGHIWASCGHRDLPGSVCSLVQLEHVSLRLLGSWNTLIIGHPSVKCCYQSVISCLWLLLDSV